MDQLDRDLTHMQRALDLAARGQGYVEPNPMVGCVIVRNDQVVGEGWHQRFGGPHAEVEALKVAGERAQGATLYVTLEPCCHQGKTPPCTEAVLAAGVRRVVAAQQDPFPQVAGGGLARLRDAGLDVEVGLLEGDARRLNAPYRKLIATGRPWILAKWAMSLDGKTATWTGSSQWISSPASREIVHAIRGRVDAILVGSGTARHDDPQLTARPPGPRTALRVVADSRASLASDSQLVRTAGDLPVLVAVGPHAGEADRQRLVSAGCEVLVCDADSPDLRLDQLLAELGRRRLTNLMVEGGGRLMGSLLELEQVDEVHVFIAPKLVGGSEARVPIAGRGVAEIAAALSLEAFEIERSGSDLYLRARVNRG